jgi:hypothetical protein
VVADDAARCDDHAGVLGAAGEPLQRVLPRRPASEVCRVEAEVGPHAHGGVGGRGVERHGADERARRLAGGLRVRAAEVLAEAGQADRGDDVGELGGRIGGTEPGKQLTTEGT